MRNPPSLIHNNSNNNLLFGVYKSRRKKHHLLPLLSDNGQKPRKSLNHGWTDLLGISYLKKQTISAKFNPPTAHPELHIRLQLESLRKPYRHTHTQINTQEGKTIPISERENYSGYNPSVLLLDYRSAAAAAGSSVYKQR